MCELLSCIVEFELLNCNCGISVKHLTHDSREVRPGSLFFALRGGKADGAKFIKQAIRRGAVAVVLEKSSFKRGILPRLFSKKIPQVFVNDAREVMSLVAKAFYDNVVDKLNVIGITGTNGKTTTAHIIGHILSQIKGNKVGIIGTLGAKILSADGGIKELVSELTTPNPIILHGLFKVMYEEGVRFVVMECSAHAIFLKKLCGINFRVGVFTNLSQDHLDFFKDYKTYANVKVNWFGASMDAVVTNIDDIEGQRIFNNVKSGVISYKLADVTNLELCSSGSKFIFGGVEYNMPLAGKFNVYNALASINVVKKLGFEDREISKALGTLESVPGRFNTVEIFGISVIIDYAHTPDSLEKILVTCRELLQGEKSGRLVSVFGCGGERDTGKREQMGIISGRLADYTVITSDNPRGESPRVIMLQIEAGCKVSVVQTQECCKKELCENLGKRYTMIEDRKEAIYHALDFAESGDIVVIAGKGAEDYIEIDGEKLPFSDMTVVEDYRNLKQKSVRKNLA